MIDLLFWFLVSQTIAGLPEMAPGTQVQIVSMDLLERYASAVIEDEWLVLEGDLKAGSEVQILIFQPDATPEETAEAALGNKALLAQVSPEADDLLVEFEELEGPLSFKKWLEEERGIFLRLIPKGNNNDDSN